MANILYRKQKQQISIDNGATWIDMDVYRVGEILENHSNCTSEQTKQCRWIELDITENYYCDNYNKYSLEVEECTENGLIWTPTGEYRKGSTLIETKSSDCGYNYVTTQVSDVLSFKYAGDESLEYKINGETTHTATTSPYSITLEDLGVTRLYNTTSMFEGTRLTELTSIPNISNLVYASGMFSHCQDLLFLDLSECPIKATHMDYMFSGCDNLKYLDISSFDTTNTREMNSMFEGCEDLTTLDVSHFVTTSAITMSYMFAFCYKLNSLNVSNFNTSKVTDMSGMFLDCRSLTSLDVSNFNTSKVTDMNNMFNVCSGLTSLDLSNFDTSNVTNVSYMFTACKSLTSLNVTGWDISNINSHTDMFTACSSLSELILGEITQSTYDWWCDRLSEASISCNIIECTILVIPVDLSFEFSGTTTTYKLNNKTYTATSSPYSTSLTELGIETLTSCYGTFSGSSITELTSFPDTSGVTNMSYMFYACNGLIKLDLSGWDVSNVTNMSYMFRRCSNIRSIDVSGWDITNVTSYSNMFSGCTSLRELIIGDVSEEIYNKWCTIVSAVGITTDLVKYNTNELQDYDLEFYYYMFKNTTAHLPRYPIYINDIEYQANLNNSKWIENNIMRYRLKLSDIGINNVSEITSFDICYASSTSSCYKTTKIPVYDVSLGCIACGDMSTELVCSLDYSKSTKLDINDKNINCVYDYNINNVTSVTLSTSMETVDISDLQIPKLTSLSSFTYNCSNIVSLDMSGWDISKVTNTYQAFYAMESLRTLNVSGLVYPSSMSQINSYSYMFYGCGITSLILGEVTQEQYNWWCARLNESSISCNIIECSIISEPDTPTSDTLSFEFSDSTTTYKLNGTTYTATSSPYTISLTDLGIETLTSCSQTFYNSTITDLISFLDTSNVTNMRQMFYKCSGLTELDLSNFNTSNVTKMDYIFEKCSGLTELDLSNFNTSNVTNMNYMFYDCRKLTTLDLSNFNTSNVTGMTGMFGNCSGLTELDLSNFDTSNVTNMSKMFMDCTSLQTLDVSSFDISNVTIMAYMLNSCTSLQTLRIKQGTYDWWCARLTDAGLSCDIIVGDEPDTPTGDTTSDTLSFEFSGSTTTYILNNKTYTATSSPYSTTLDDLGIETLTSCDTTFGFNSSITKVTSFPDTSNVTDMDSMFWNCKNITSINLENFNTSNVTSMIAMFSDCSGLTSLDLSSFDTSNVTNMNYMFRRCSNLQTLNVTGWNVLQVTKYNDMFINCTSLNRLILGEVSQSTYDWWCARLTDAGLSCDVIECTIVSRPGGGIVDAE